MSKNPYSTLYTTRKGEPLQSMTGSRVAKDGKLRASATPFVNAKGEINAYDKKDLLSSSAALVSAAQNGEVIANRSADAKARISMVANQILDNRGVATQLIAEDLSDIVNDHVNREDFLSKIFTSRKAKPGEEIRIQFHTNQSIAIVMGEEGFQPYVATAEQQYRYPAEYEIVGKVMIKRKDIIQNSADLLSIRLTDGMETCLQQRDVVLHKLSTEAANMSGNQEYFTQLTPSVFANLTNMITTKGMNCTTALIAGDLIPNLLTNPESVRYWDPITQHEIILSGVIGQLHGVNIMSDKFVNHKKLRVLQNGECFFYSSQDTLGQHIIRYAIQSEPVDGKDYHRPAQGWMFYGLESCYIANPDAVVHGIRL